MKSRVIFFVVATWLASLTPICLAEPPSLVELRAQAEQGDGYAQYNLGLMYDNGEGVKQDCAEAAKWYRKAAEQGGGYAQYKLGEAYNQGRGVPKNDVESVKWIRKAADKGVAIAQYDLGAAYVRGEGVPRDYVEAYMWFSLAAVPGEQQYKGKFARTLAEASLVAIERGEIVMTPEEIAQAQKLAAAWQPKAN